MESLTEEESERMRVGGKWVERTDLWQVTDSLWQCVFYEKQENEKKGAGFYRWSARKTKQRFDPRYKPINKRHMSCAINASRQLVRTLYPWRPHIPRIVTLLTDDTIHSMFTSSSKLKFITVRVGISSINPWTYIRQHESIWPSPHLIPFPR